MLVERLDHDPFLDHFSCCRRRCAASSLASRTDRLTTLRNRCQSHFPSEDGYQPSESSTHLRKEARSGRALAVWFFCVRRVRYPCQEFVADGNGSRAANCSLSRLTTYLSPPSTPTSPVSPSYAHQDTADVFGATRQIRRSRQRSVHDHESAHPVESYSSRFRQRSRGPLSSLSFVSKKADDGVQMFAGVDRFVTGKPQIEFAKLAAKTKKHKL